MVLPKGPTRPGQPKKQELTVLDVAPVAGQTTGEAVYAVVLGDKETWLGTKADGTPTDYSMGKIETRLNARDNLTVGAVDSVNGATGTVVLDAADVGASAVTSVYDGPDARTHPTLTKPLSASILDVGDHAMDTQMWPWLVDLRLGGGTGVALLWSSDHDTSNDGIYMATAASPTGTYTVTGQVYDDTTAGSQTETPSAIWDADNSRWNLYYHQDGLGPGAQSTVLATTTDFSTFTRVGVIDPNWDSTMPGDGHNGYFRPFRIGADWFAWGLYDGSDYSHDALWRSHDGETWYTAPILLGHETPWLSHLTGATDHYQIDWALSTLLHWRGAPWLLGFVRDREVLMSGGTVGTGAARIVAAPLTPGLDGIAARPIDITPTLDQAWEGDEVTGIGNAFAWDGHVYLPYRAGSSAVSYQTHSFGILEVA